MVLNNILPVLGSTTFLLFSVSICAAVVAAAIIRAGLPAPKFLFKSLARFSRLASEPYATLTIIIF